MTLTLPSNYRSYEVDIPAEWDVEVVSPQPVTLRPAEQIIDSALDLPVGSPTLAEIVTAKLKSSPGMTCIICEDLTRYSPTQKIVPQLLNRLNDTGVADGETIVVMALGTHRPMTREEIEAKVGAEVVNRVAVYNSEFYDKKRLINMGSFRGYPLWLDRRVADASIRIGVGSVVPNPVAGWSGGGKIMIPGITGEETVRGFHLSSHEFHENMYGRELTPARQLMESLVKEIGLDFVVNSVYTPGGEIYAAICGDFVQAQRAAVRQAKSVYAAPARRKAGLVISNAYPTETDLWQAGKAFHSGALLAEDGGEVVLVAPCPEGLGPHETLPELYEWALKDREDLLRAVTCGAVKDVIGASSALMRTRTIMSRVRLGIVSENLDLRMMQRMGFTVYESLDEVIERRGKQSSGAMKASIITHGGSTFPVVV